MAERTCGNCEYFIRRDVPSVNPTLKDLFGNRGVCNNLTANVWDTYSEFSPSAAAVFSKDRGLKVSGLESIIEFTANGCFRDKK
jgi:hypothetical protein